MRIGCIISMYKELPQVEKNLRIIKNENCPTVIIQSNPGSKELILDSPKVIFIKAKLKDLDIIILA